MNTGKSRIMVLVVGLVFLLPGGVGLAAPAAEWSGTVAAVSGDDLALVGVADHFRLAGGVTEMLSGRSLAPEDLAAGSSVTLRLGPREADGRLRADGVAVEPKNPLVLTGELGKASDDLRRVEIHGIEIEIDDHTAFSGRGPSGAVRSARDLAAGMTVQAMLVATASGTLRATDVRTRPEPVIEPGEDMEIRGTVTAVSGPAWTVDAQSFAVTDQTIFLGDPGLGDFVEVKFHLAADGSPVADRIQKEDEPPGIEIEFRGIVEAIGDSAWTISGRVVSVDASTRIVGSPSVGDPVEVEAHKAGDTLVARSIRLEDAGEQAVEFTGVVQGIGQAAWKIAGREVGVTPSTEIRGNPGVGDLVEVRALQGSGGSLMATRIRREDSSGRGDAGDDHGGGNGSSGGPGGDPAGDDRGHGGSGSRGGSGHGGDD